MGSEVIKAIVMGYKNHATTATGAGSGAAVYLTGVGYRLPSTTEEWTTFIISIALCILGLLAKDGKTGSPPEAKQVTP